MPKKVMKKYPVVLSVAGSDSGGGAGIQADLKTIETLGGFGTTVITALTAQNTLGVKSIFPIPAEFVQQQFEAVASDIEILAVKTGMLHNAEIVEVVAECVKKYNIKYFIVDPVMVATSGGKLIEDNTIEIMKRKLFPLATLITPNLYEAEILLERKINSIEEMKSAAVDLLEFGSKCALVKGGHLDLTTTEAGNTLVDVFRLAGNNTSNLLESKRVITNNTHGTGCTLSAAIATYCAFGYELSEAISKSQAYVYNAILSGASYRLGNGNGPLHHSFKQKN